LLRGTLLANSDRFAEAEQVFHEAAQRPSFVPIRRAALFAAASCELILARREADQIAASQLRERALGTARQLYEPGHCSPEIAALITKVAIEAGDLDLARTAINAWERQAPGDLRALRRRMTVEFRSEAYGPAVAAAERVLARQPHDNDAQNIRAIALKHLGR
jgi:Flp pilus assembly protein TadD